MIRKALYFKTVGFLQDADRNNMLRYRSVTHCAVATLIVANMGYRSRDCFIIGDWYLWNIEVDHGNWHDVLHCHNNLEVKAELLQEIGADGFEMAERQLRSTGYTYEELLKIQEAFEDCKVGDEKSDYKKGLNAVLNVLKEIHLVTVEDLGIQPSASRYFIGIPAFLKLFFPKCFGYVTEMKIRLKAIIKEAFKQFTFFVTIIER